jgi:subtilisin family serine protease
MKHKFLGIGICMLLIAAVGLPAVGTMNKRELLENTSTMECIPGEFIVKLKKDTTFSSSAQLTALNEKHQVYAYEKIFPYDENTILDNIYLLHAPLESDILSITYEYSVCPDVIYSEPNAIGSLCGIPNDANFSNQWHLHNTGQVFLQYNGHNYSGKPDADIDAPEAWDIEIGDPNIVIAIVDTGIDYTHPDLAANVWNNTNEIPGNGIDDDHNGYIDDIRGWDFYYNDSNVTDGYGHGTMCSGVADAIGNNGLWGAGVCWNCKVMPVRAFNASGWGNITSVSKGIEYAANNGADVCSMSFAFGNISTLKDAIDYAFSKGVFLCAAAGNSNYYSKLYPAAYENVVAVAATTHNDTRVTPNDWPGGWGSQYGDWVDIAAPGNIIFTTLPTYHCYFNDFGACLNFDWGCGTSFASPMVGGVAALLLSKDPLLTPDEIKALLCGNVDPYNSTEYIGTGRLNAQKALTALQSPSPPTIKGTEKGKTGQPYDYKFKTSDPTNDKIYFLVEWGDNTTSGWLGPYYSGEEITLNHTWSVKGTYTIKAKAKDVYGDESDWASLIISMPRSYMILHQPFLERFFERFPHLFPILRNLLGY